MIRHTVDTMLLRHGVDIRAVEEVLGHASIAMTDRYTHVSRSTFAPPSMRSIRTITLVLLNSIEFCRPQVIGI